MISREGAATASSLFYCSKPGGEDRNVDQNAFQFAIEVSDDLSESDVFDLPA